MTDESVCSVCSRLAGFGDEERFEPPVNLARCPAPGGMECRAVAQAVAPLRRENEVLRSNSDHLSSENASLARQVESMAMRIESLAEELAKPEDVRLREVLDALDGRFPIFDSLASRVCAALDEADEFIARAGEAERERARLRKLFDDAGQGEHNILALVDHYQRESMEADERLRTVRALLEKNGCDCDCDHGAESHDADCDRCLACRISWAIET